MKTLITVSVLAVIAFAGPASLNVTPDDTENEIIRVLTDQADAWNRGSIDSFMDGYVRSKELRFASGDDVTFGWEPTRQRYHRRYSDRSLMGRLSFTDMSVTQLSPEFAEVFGRWNLTRNAPASSVAGRFTLLLRRTEAGWKILHDHTSTGPPSAPDSAAESVEP